MGKELAEVIEENRIVYRKIQRLYGEDADYLIDDGSEEYSVVVENIAGMFNVSRQAAEIRLGQLDLLQVA